MIMYMATSLLCQDYLILVFYLSNIIMPQVLLNLNTPAFISIELIYENSVQLLLEQHSFVY